MIRVLFSPQAEADLEEIGDFIAQDSPLRALSFVQELRQHALNIGTTPQAFRARPELGEGLRGAVRGNYLLFYTHDHDTVRIQRIMHGSRDITPEDFSDTGLAPG